MPVIINGSTGISGTDGSAGTPAVQGTDTNTGMFFPASDTVAVASGGSERARITAAGELLVGTTAVAASDWFTTTPVGVFSANNNAQLRVHRPSTGDGVGAGAVLFAASDGSGNQRDIAAVRCETTAVNAGGGALAFLTRPNSGSLTERARITSTGNLQFNSGYGSVATAYGCRAWVNFNGTGTVAIRASGNVSSITDNGTGDYTINLTTAMPDANYATVAAGSNNSGGSYTGVQIVSQTTSAVRIQTWYASLNVFDALFVPVSIFR